MRLIDADALKMEVGKEYDGLYPTASGGFDEFATRVIPYIIDVQPMVDAEVVRYGKWGEPFRNIYGDRVFPCSECSYLVLKIENYCPNCGAKMDGDKHD